MYSYAPTPPGDAYATGRARARRVWGRAHVRAPRPAGRVARPRDRASEACLESSSNVDSLTEVMAMRASTWLGAAPGRRLAAGRCLLLALGVKPQAVHALVVCRTRVPALVFSTATPPSVPVTELTLLRYKYATAVPAP